MRKDKVTALRLRRSGKSYNFISSSLNIPKSTLSGWFSNSSWSKNIKYKLTQKAFEENLPKFRKMAEANQRRWELWRNSAREAAEMEFKQYKDRSLFCAGVMLYWGEGDKNPKNPVRLSNTDPRLLRVFVKFLKRYADDYTAKAHIILYPDLDEKVCKDYWSSQIHISSHNFYKTQHIVGRHKTRRLGYGIGVVSIGSRQLKEKILKWIELYSKYRYAGMV